MTVGKELFGEACEGLTYLPSPDYLESGKFKMPRYVQELLSNKGQNYREFYMEFCEKMSKSISSLNFKSLAQVV